MHTWLVAVLRMRISCTSARTHVLLRGHMGGAERKAAKYICRGFHNIPEGNVLPFLDGYRGVGNMGLCVSAAKPPRAERTTRAPVRREKLDENGLGGVAERYARPVNAGTGTATSSLEVYSREEARLRDLFSALRTGLVFSTAEFSVLPRITTTAKVKFSIGSNALLQASAQKAREKAEKPEESKEDGGEEDEEEQREEEEEEGEGCDLTVTLYGASWTRGVYMRLEIWPVVGTFAGRKLLFTWKDNILMVSGCNRGELNARALPVSFENETDFCRCCLLLAYHSDSAGNLHVEEAPETSTPTPSDGIVPTLSSLAYQRAVSNLDAVPNGVTIPSKLAFQLYGSADPVTIAIRIWPSTYASQFSASPTMKVKSGLVFKEFVHLLKDHFHIPTSDTVILKLYHNYKPVQMSEVLTSRFKSIDCFVITYHDEEEACSSLGSGSLEGTADANATLVVSLVGQDVQNVEVSLETKLGGFDAMLRNHFRLGRDSFLVIVAEDDFSPQYTLYDNWKCIYPFTLPERSFGAELRRSMRRLSQRRRERCSSTHSAASPRSLPSEAQGQNFTPEIDQIMELLSSSSRNFPSNSGRFDFTIEELYEKMPMYQLSLERCGIHPHAIIQVFEVTGPSIPVKFRVLSDHSQPSRQPVADKGKAMDVRVSRHANVMDINPNWSIHTFLQYIDAVISPASGVRRKRVSLGDNFLEDSEDLSALSLGELLDLWKPAWWQRKNGGKPLSLRDIDPAEFLLVEKYSQTTAASRR